MVSALHFQNSAFVAYLLLFSFVLQLLFLGITVILSPYVIACRVVE